MRDEPTSRKLRPVTWTNVARSRSAITCAVLTVLLCGHPARVATAQDERNTYVAYLKKNALKLKECIAEEPGKLFEIVRRREKLGWYEEGSGYVTAVDTSKGAEGGVMELKAWHLGLSVDETATCLRTRLILVDKKMPPPQDYDAFRAEVARRLRRFDHDYSGDPDFVRELAYDLVNYADDYPDVVDPPYRDHHPDE